MTNPGEIALAALALAAPPMAVTLAAALVGAIAWLPALLVMLAAACGALLAVSLHASDLDRLDDAVPQRASGTAGGTAGGTGTAEARPASGRPPRLPRLAALKARLDRQAREAGEATAEAIRRWQAEAAIVEHLPDPLVLLGPKYEVRRANAAARTSFGADLQAVLRHPLLRGAVDRALASAAPGPIVADLLLPAPVEREVQLTVLRLAGQSGTVPVAAGQVGAEAGVVVVLSDRTRERAVERMRADFVANVSHELRTPLTSLIGFVDTLRGPAADDKPAQRRFLGIMAQQAERMKQLIDDLLSLSRIELTEHLPPSEQVDLAALTSRMIAGFELRLAERRIRCEMTVAPAIGTITGDEGQLGQVLQNLLDNGVKYGKDGGALTVSLCRAARGAPGPAREGVMLAITDDGHGIPRHDLPRLTERFYRVDKARSRAVGGTGLGLAIVKHIVNRHRGQLTIESEEGSGTTVSVWLPR